MDITQSALWAEVEEIRDSGSKPVHYRWRCQIDVGDTIIDADQVIDIDVTRLYQSKFSDEILLTVSLLKKAYIESVFPNKDQLIVSLLKEPLGEVSNADDYDTEPDVRIYRGLLTNTEDPTTTNQASAGSTPEEREFAGYEEVVIQLIDRAAEQLRMKTVGGIYRDMTPGAVVQGVLSAVAGDLGLDEREAIIGVDMVPADNQDPRNHIVIPQGTPVTQIPKYVHQHEGGVYQHGLGYYLQNRIWYVYPEHAIDRFASEPRSLTVVNMPSKRLPGIERTYFTDGERTVIIATGSSKHIDVTEKAQMTLGNGVRFALASRMINRFRTVESNIPIVVKDDNVKEVAIRQRRVGLNYAPMSPRRITDNPYFELSQLADRVGQYLEVQWENAEADLLYPGMPVRYVYAEGEDLVELTGQLAGATHRIALKGQGRTADRYRCDVSMLLFVEKAS